MAAECIPNKERAKPRVPWEILAVRKKHADVETDSKCNRRNPTNINQNGFRRNQSTTSQILTFHWILGIQAKNLKVTIFFADFSKAFYSSGKMEQILLAYNLTKETVAAIMML